MPNKNCLAGMQCPKCGSEGPYRITAKAIVIVDDDGTDGIEDVDWDGGSDCSCVSCCFLGKAYIFETEYQKKPIMAEEDRELVNYCDLHCETDRALFTGKDIDRMFRLAGEVTVVPPSRHNEWFPMKDEMRELVDKARARHRRPLMIDGREV